MLSPSSTSIILRMIRKPNSIIVYYNNTVLHLLYIDRALITLGFKMLLRMGPLLRLSQNVITYGTFIGPVITLVPSKTVFLSNSPLRILHILN